MMDEWDYKNEYSKKSHRRGYRYGWIASKLRKWLGIGNYPLHREEMMRIEKWNDAMFDFTKVYESDLKKSLKEAYPLKTDVTFPVSGWFEASKGEGFVIGWDVENYEPRILLMYGTQSISKHPYKLTIQKKGRK